MGILDDAIRQHLDLKRRQGAEEGELQRLEDEAFGPPTRPGEPDFPGSAPDAAEAAESGTGEAVAVSDQPPVEPATGEAVAVSDQTPAESATGEAPSPAQEPLLAEEPPPERDRGFYDQTDEQRAAATEPAAEPQTGAQEPPIESHDTVEHHFEDAIEDTREAEAVEEPATGEEPDG